MTAPEALRRSIATVSLSGTLEEKLDAIAAAGFDGIELFESDLVSCPWSPARVRARCAELGLTIELYQPLRDVEALPRELHARAARRARRKLELAADLGAPLVLVCSNVSPDTVDDDDLAAADLAELGQVAADLGLRVAYEALAWGRYVSSYLHSWEIVRLAGHDSVGICLDSFHILSRGDTLAGLAEVPADKVLFVQLADAPYVLMDVLQWSRHHRCFPGQGSFDLPGFVETVLRHGYRGPLSLEIFNDVIRRADPDRTAVGALRSLLALEDAVVGRGGATLPDAGLQDAGLPRTALRALPPLSGLQAIRAVALQGDGTSAPVLDRSLAAMGFERDAAPSGAGSRSWHHGPVELSVARGTGREGERGEAVLAALGVVCDEPEGVAARARALLAPVARSARGDDLHLDAITAPDGRTIELWPSPAEREGPTAGTDRARAEGSGSGSGSAPQPGALTGIDHVVISQLFDYFDDAMLFYRSVLGLRPQEPEELASPDGLLRSRALRSPCGHVRLALNAAVTGGGGAHLADRQHIAFSCTDVTATARQWRRAGVPILHMPDNYYEDLAARLDLDAAFVTSLQELDLLYDRDGGGGELYHLYTESVGDKLFFELVHRVAPYDGYGALNASVRMAAQRWREHDRTSS